MSALPSPNSNPFAADVAEGLSADPKRVDPRYLYDQAGTALFETASLLPEFGTARAEERLRRRYSAELARLTCSATRAGDLKTGSARVSDDWLRNALQLVADRENGQPLLFTLLGSSIGALDRSSFFHFLEDLRQLLKPGDFLVFDVDLVKDIEKMVSAYDDSAGIAAAFNRNLLCRINRQLRGRFNVRAFDHAVTWNTLGRCIELQLVASEAQEIYIGELGRRFVFAKGESIRTLCDYKYSERELEELADSTGFHSVKTWIDIEWAFAQLLWAA